MNNISKIFIISVFLILSFESFSQEGNNVVEKSLVDTTLDTTLDSTKQKGGFVKLVYERFFFERNETKEDLEKQYQYLLDLNGKKIGTINIKALDVFGASFAEPDKNSDYKLGRWANKIHTKTNLKIIWKNLVIKPGEIFDADIVLDNERIIRDLPYINDVRFMVSERPENPEVVDILVYTKDVFSYGMTGNFEGLKSSELELYNQNLWGMGHQVSMTMVTNANKTPHFGFESAYSVKNFEGHFIDLSISYANNYKNEGMTVGFEKQFLRSATKWGGGISYARFTRASHLMEGINSEIDYPLDYIYLNVWGGYSFQLNKDDPDKNMQLVLSGAFRKYEFIDKPDNPQNEQYFANSDIYLASLTLSKRRFIRDYLIYSYGITEDIPRGFMHELVAGVDNNELNRRWYLHTYFSTGNIVRYKPHYMFASFGIGGFFNSSRFQQGLMSMEGNYISRIFKVGNQRIRQFVNLSYIVGIRRQEIENVYLRYGTGIRGFESNLAKGKQKLSLNLESVFFQNSKILRFNVALYGFVDVGVIGSNRKFILNQNYYSGIGIGARLRNENLVFRTIQLRLAYYPGSPSDIGAIGAILEERTKSTFYSFQPRKPEPLRFE